MLYKGPVIIITALFSDRKTFGKSLRISVKFCHWNPKNSEILSKLRNSELTGASGFNRPELNGTRTVTFGRSIFWSYHSSLMELLRPSPVQAHRSSCLSMVAILLPFLKRKLSRQLTKTTVLLKGLESFDIVIIYLVRIVSYLVPCD